MKVHTIVTIYVPCLVHIRQVHVCTLFYVKILNRLFHLCNVNWENILQLMITNGKKISNVFSVYKKL